jgi:nucleotide-binding universal stress UspA family protein
MALTRDIGPLRRVGNLWGRQSTKPENVTMTAENGSRDAPHQMDHDTIVVGHDGSLEATAALAEALDLARVLGVRLGVVRAWSLVTAPRPPDWEFGYVPAFDEYAEAVQRALVDDVRSTLEEFPEVQAECRAVHAGAATAKTLVDLSEDARMLVVGARGLGGLSGMLLGSVSEQCVRHAACSVLVARSQS